MNEITLSQSWTNFCTQFVFFNTENYTLHLKAEFVEIAEAWVSFLAHDDVLGW